jgi:hypothetical protein
MKCKSKWTFWKFIGLTSSKTINKQGQISVLKNGKWRKGIHRKGLVACNQHGRNIKQQSHHTYQLAEMSGSSLGAAVMRRRHAASLRCSRVRV